MTNARSMLKQNDQPQSLQRSVLAKIKSVPQTVLLVVFSFSLLFSSQAVSAAVGDSGFAWNLIRKNNAQIVCTINIAHEGEPTSGEVKQTCGEDLFTGWQNGDYNLSKAVPTATPTALIVPTATPMAAGYSWLDIPDTAADLQMNLPLTYLAGKLIAAGYVDVSTCNGSALLPNGYASPCGMTAAQPYVFIWQNRFDEFVFDSAVNENIPAYMFKNLLIQESQMWPQASGHVPPEYGIGQLTENGSDTLLMWNNAYFKKICHEKLDNENCKKDYLSISSSERAYLRGSALIEVRADCANCPNRIDLEITEKSISVFAAALKANFHQIDQIAKNLTGKAAVSQMEWQEVWKLSTANYHAGPGCTSNAMRATLKERKPLRWKFISKNFQAGCESAVDYVEHIITTGNSVPLPPADQIESARRVIYGLPSLTPAATPASDSASAELSIAQQLESAHIQDQIVVKIDPKNSEEALQVIASLGIDLTTDSTLIGSLESLIVKVDASQLDSILTALQNASSIEFAGLNYLVTLAGTPDDPEFPAQTNLTAIQAPQAWDMFPSMPQVLVAVIDTGVDVTHPDLSTVIWQNPAETGLDANGADKSHNGIDDDSNGYVDDWQGWNMVAGNNNANDDQGHGTHLAGIIGAQTNNGIGIAGIAPNARILPVKVLDNSGYGTHATVAEGIVYAVDMGARVINLGFGGTGSSDVLRDAIDYALAHNVVVVAAGGNKGDDTTYYPAGYVGVVAVSSVDNGLALSASSSYGNHISIAAPGDAVRSTFPGGAYSDASGTSMSSAHVSGVAVLLASQPQFIDKDYLTSALFGAALDLGAPGHDPYFGYGLIHAFDALNYDGAILPIPGMGSMPVPGEDVGILTDMAGSTLNAYAPSCGTSAYGAQLSGTSVPTLLADNAVSAPISLGFELWYMGTRYTDVYVSSNGWLSFNAPGGNSLPLNALDNSAGIADNTAARPIIAPLWDDLGGAAAGSAASYTTSGTAPTRTFTFEWWNFEWNAASGSRMSARVVLHESTGVIDFMYYPNDVNPGANASIGITGTSNTSFISAQSFAACPAWSNVADATTLGAKPLLDTIYTFTPAFVPLASPGNISLSNVTKSSVTLNWTDNSTGEDGFSIYTSTDGNNYTYFGQVTANTTTFNATGLLNSANNYWKVYAVVEGNASISASVPAPSALNFTGVAATSMTLNWSDNSDNEAAFYVLRSVDNVNFSLVSTTAANAVTYNAAGLLPNTTYYWRVQAVGDTAVSAAASASQVTSDNILASAPLVAILSPIDGSSFSQGAKVRFTGQALIPVNGDISSTIQWTSSIDGLFGAGSSLGYSSLTPGIHTITASAVNSVGTGQDTATITIVARNQDPHGGYTATTDKCAACHRTHTAQSPELIASPLSGNAFCLSCHSDGNVVVSTHSNKDWAGLRVEASFELLCTQCHEPHGSTNLFSIRPFVQVTSNTNPIVTTGPINFTATTGPNSYDDGVSATANRLCVACHVNPSNPGSPMVSHSGGANHNGAVNYSGTDCVSCHKHSADSSPLTGDGFMASCRACHSTTQDLGNGTPRRQIVGATGGDFTRASHHVSGSDLITDGDCQVCHEMSQHMAGKVRLFDVDVPATVYTLDYVLNAVDDPADYENFCISCHDGDGRAGNQAPFSDLKLAPSLDGTMWSAAAHNSIDGTFTGSCLDCHDSGHGSNKSKILKPWNFLAGTAPDALEQEEKFCFSCHTTGPGLPVSSAFSTWVNLNTPTRIYTHNVSVDRGLDHSKEIFGSSFANRHVECGDCHEPHINSYPNTAAAPDIKLTQSGATGVEPANYGVAAGAPDRFNFLSQAEKEYQTCFKCHSSYTTLPVYAPDGLVKLTSTNVNQVKDQRDLAAAFNPANASFHPLAATGKNASIPPGGFVAGWSVSSWVYCSDCHTNASPTVPGAGPHGSPLLHILDGSAAGATDYTTANGNGNGPQVLETEICFKCHKYTTYVTGTDPFANTNFRDGGNNFHSEHMNGSLTTATCYTCHNSHGSEQVRLINFDASVVTFDAGINSQTAFTLTANGGSCALACHGQNHNPENYAR